MDSKLEIALIAAGVALLGALVGATAPIVVGLLTSRAETRRERLRIATQLTLADDKYAMELAHAAAARADGVIRNIAPIAANFIYHLRLVNLAASGSHIRPEDLAALGAEKKRLFEATKE
jgi:hypothetical protein